MSECESFRRTRLWVCRAASMASPIAARPLVKPTKEFGEWVLEQGGGRLHHFTDEPAYWLEQNLMFVSAAMWPTSLLILLLVFKGARKDQEPIRRWVADSQFLLLAPA